MRMHLFLFALALVSAASAGELDATCRQAGDRGFKIQREYYESPLVLGYRWHDSPATAWDLIIGVNSNLETYRPDTDRRTDHYSVDLLFGGQRLWMLSESRVYPFVGASAEVGYRLRHYDTSHYANTNTKWSSDSYISLRGGGLAGVEWRLSPRLSLSAQYNLVAEYNLDYSSDKNREDMIRYSHSEYSTFYLRGMSLGLLLYFE